MQRRTAKNVIALKESKQTLMTFNVTNDKLKKSQQYQNQKPVNLKF